MTVLPTEAARQGLCDLRSALLDLRAAAVRYQDQAITTEQVETLELGIRVLNLINHNLAIWSEQLGDER